MIILNFISNYKPYSYEIQHEGCYCFRVFADLILQLFTCLKQKKPHFDGEKSCFVIGGRRNITKKEGKKRKRGRLHTNSDL